LTAWHAGYVELSGFWIQILGSHGIPPAGGVLQPLPDHIEQVGVLVAPGQAAHHPGEVELSLELPDEPPDRGLGRPRPGTGGIGVEADLDSHHSGRALATRGQVAGENTARWTQQSLGTLELTVLSGRYRLESKLGSGGCPPSTSPSTRSSTDRSPIKLLHREISEEADHSSDSAARPEPPPGSLHPNLVGCIDAGEDDGRPYIVFEYIEGRTLKRRIQRRAAAGGRGGGLRN
jgi:hypothetical protein